MALMYEDPEKMTTEEFAELLNDTPITKELEKGLFSISESPSEVGGYKLDRFPPHQRLPFDSLEHYLELSENGGLRPSYRRLFESVSPAPDDPKYLTDRWFSNAPLGDSIQISKIPLILTQDEQRLINCGSDQIGRALRALWNDLVFEAVPKILKEGIVPFSVVNYGPTVEGAHLDSLSAIRKYWSGLRRDAVAFTFGIDLVRAPDGNFTFCEINVGSIGGRCDVDYVARRFCNWYWPIDGTGWEGSSYILPTRQYRDSIEYVSSVNSGYEPVIAQSPYRSDTRSIWQEHLSNAARASSTRMIDGEYEREIQEMKWHGLKELADTPEDLLVRLSRGKTLALGGRWILELSEGLDLFQRNLLRLTTAPGVEDLLSNKLLLSYWEKIVQFYLKEEAILKPIPTVVATLEKKPGNWRTSVQLFQKSVGDWPSNFYIEQGIVIKDPSGSQGKEVILEYPYKGRDRSKECDPFAPLDHLEDMVITDAFRRSIGMEAGAVTPLYIVQPMIRPSIMNDRIVDIRPIGCVSGEADVHLYEVPWGRLSGSIVVRDRSPKTNVSLGGLELPVIVEREQNSAHDS